MKNEITVLVVEDGTAAGPKASTMLRGAGMQVQVVDSCGQAMNKMLEYMDLIVVDSRVQGCTGKTLEMIKSRITTTRVVVVCPESELSAVRLGGRVRADAYVSLGCGGVEFGLTMQSVYAGSARAVWVGAKTPRRRFFTAA
ncbi:MAG: hypothetical protein KKE73_00540 [Proteobacteria bacterium]|nr:hypothetical protein [Pseudomonadota bacterium]